MKISMQALFKRSVYFKQMGYSMRKSALLAALLLSYSAADAQITINRNSASLQQVLFQLRNQSGYDLFYDADLIKNYNGLNINVKDVTLDVALKSILKNTSLDYKIQNKSITLVPKSVNISNSNKSQQSSTTGIVVDKNGNPIVGASVKVSNDANKSTLTDQSGNFIFPYNLENQNLTVSYLGFKTKNVKVVAGRNRIVLDNTENQVEEVIVTGMVDRKKETFTGASSTFTLDEIKQVGNTNVIQALKSLDPSFLLMENNLAGSNPNALATIELRGQTSITTDALRDEFSEDPNQPLFILDGFPTTLRIITDLDINRIASVTILKDAASTAIYGSRASNGVVVVETVRPKAGELTINYTSDLNLEFPDLSSYNMMNAAEKLEFEKLSGRYQNHPRLDKAENQIILDELYSLRLQNIARGVDSYWLSDPVQNSFSQRHSLMVNGGEGSLSYGVGGDLRSNNGVMKGSSRDTWGTRLNLQYRDQKLRVSNMLYVNGYKSNESPYGEFSTWANTNPYYEKAPSTQAYLDQVYNNYKLTTEYIANPLYLASIGNFDREKNYALINNTQVRWDVNNNWILNGSLQINKKVTEADVFKSPRHTDYRTTDILEKGRLQHRGINDFNYTLNADLIYSNVFKEKHIVNGQLRAEVYNKTAISDGFIAVGFPTFSTGSPRFAYGYEVGARPQSSKVISRRNSLISTLNYSYDKRYNIDATFSYDGSTAFGVDNLYSPFFALGASWNLHQEEFFKNSGSAINLLRLRANYGKTGNQNFTSYTSITTYNYENGYNYWGQGVNVGSLGNQNLEWQNTATTSLGVDFGVWNNRFTGNINAYRKYTDPLVVAIALPPSTALSNYPINAGNLNVDGLEATLKYSPIYRLQDRVVWTLGFTGSTYKQRYNGFNNILQSLNANLKQSKSLIQYRDGGDPSDIWAVPSIGIDPATGNELFLKKDGTYSFQYDFNDAVVVGNSRPSLQGVLNSNLTYKGFTASMIVRYVVNQDVFNTALYNKVENITMAQLLSNNQDKRALYDRWKNVGDIASFKKIQLIDLNNSNLDLDIHPETTPMSSRFVQTENRLSFESISLGYDIRNKNWLNAARLANLKITGFVNEIAYFSNVRRERGITYPYARTVSFSISANFK